MFVKGGGGEREREREREGGGVKGTYHRAFRLWVRLNLIIGDINRGPPTVLILFIS